MQSKQNSSALLPRAVLFYLFFMDKVVLKTDPAFPSMVASVFADPKSSFHLLTQTFPTVKRNFMDWRGLDLPGKN